MVQVSTVAHAPGWSYSHSLFTPRATRPSALTLLVPCPSPLASRPSLRRFHEHFGLGADVERGVGCLGFDQEMQQVGHVLFRDLFFQAFRH